MEPARRSGGRFRQRLRAVFFTAADFAVTPLPRFAAAAVVAFFRGAVALPAGRAGRGFAAVPRFAAVLAFFAGAAFFAAPGFFAGVALPVVAAPFFFAALVVRAGLPDLAGRAFGITSSWPVRRLI